MDSKRLNAVESDIRATGDEIVADAEHLQAVEQEKVSLDPKDPRRMELTLEGERLTSRMKLRAKVETALVTEAAQGSA